MFLTVKESKTTKFLHVEQSPYQGMPVSIVRRRPEVLTTSTPRGSDQLMLGKDAEGPCIPSSLKIVFQCLSKECISGKNLYVNS